MFRPAPHRRVTYHIRETTPLRVPAVKKGCYFGNAVYIYTRVLNGNVFMNYPCNKILMIQQKITRKKMIPFG